MPAWLVPILLQYVLPEVLKLLVKYHFITELEADLAKKAVSLEEALGKITTYRNYPGDPPGQTNEHNFTVGQKPA